ncbi:MAG: twin transmembrane helix small protein [Gammaproteobacteria bacterium]|nr:twin transmembrane helix small protein [Gammaproteobacteria bacterium]MBT8124801.1 twin transmembrane helix small protein [Gammaproteobacteria bacterium]NNC67330.1 twin transmembrane helix small protein [Gammaproteobacteria bacterium]
MKIIIILLFLAALGSLASAMVFLVKDKGETNRTAKALTYRIGISVFIFTLLMLAYFAGYIEPHGIAG